MWLKFRKALVTKYILPRNHFFAFGLFILGAIHTSCCCRAKPIIIRCGTSTAFFKFDSYIEPNLSNLITNQAKTSFICEKMTVVIKFLQRENTVLLDFQIKRLGSIISETLLLPVRKESIQLHGGAYYFHIVI